MAATKKPDKCAHLPLHLRSTVGGKILQPALQGSRIKRSGNRVRLRTSGLRQVGMHTSLDRAKEIAP